MLHPSPEPEWTLSFVGDRKYIASERKTIPQWHGDINRSMLYGGAHVGSGSNAPRLSAAGETYAVTLC